MTDFALSEGWEFVIYAAQSTKVYTDQTSVSILDGQYAGWLFNVLILSNNPQIEVSLELDLEKVAVATPSRLFYGGSVVPANGVPYTYLYGTYLPDNRGIPQYGMAYFNNIGTQFNSSIRIDISQATSPITLYDLEYEYIRVTDKKLFKESLSDAGSIANLLKGKQGVPGISVGAKK